MKFGFRIPSITKRIAARTSVKRIVQNELWLKAPRGYGLIIQILNNYLYLTLMVLKVLEHISPNRNGKRLLY